MSDWPPELIEACEGNDAVMQTISREAPSVRSVVKAVLDAAVAFRDPDTGTSGVIEGGVALERSITASEAALLERAEAAEAERDAARGQHDAIIYDLRRAVERVGVLEAALRDWHDALYRLYRESDYGATITLCDALAATFPERMAVRAVLAVPEGDTK